MWVLLIAINPGTLELVDDNGGERGTEMMSVNQ